MAEASMNEKAVISAVLHKGIYGVLEYDENGKWRAHARLYRNGEHLLEAGPVENVLALQGAWETTVDNFLKKECAMNPV